MTALIDTNSLLAFVRYYLPFDKTFWEAWLTGRLDSGDIIILDSVQKECSRVSGSLVLKELPWLEKRKGTATAGLIAPRPERFNARVDDHFARQHEKRELSPEEYEVLKRKWLKDADAHLIIKALQIKEAKEEVCIVSEESATENDGKLFKKIPAIAQLLQLDSCSLPQYFSRIGLKAQFKF